jgi:hypothetical protein
MLGLCLLTGCGTQFGAPPVPDGDQVAGRVVSQTSDGSNQAGTGGVEVGAFTRAVMAGPVLQKPPHPVATAMTSSDGLFLLTGLEAGRYFITATQPGPFVAGKWVRVADARGASVLLVNCTDCPRPLTGAG